MQFTLDQTALGLLQGKQKIVQYLSNVFTKTYFAIGNNTFTLFLQGSQGAYKQSIQVDCPEEIVYLQVDYTKWSNALSKMTFSDAILISVTEKHIKIAPADQPKNSISLGITQFEIGSSESQMISTYIGNMFDNQIKPSNTSVTITQEFKELLAATSSFFSATGNNNAIAITPTGEIIYADRSVVYKASIPDMKTIFTSNIPTQLVTLHKYIIGLLQIMGRQGSDFNVSFNKDYNVLHYQSAGVEFIITAEPAEISIPTQAEWEQIIPKKPKRATALVSDIKQALAFFSGFYEASVWKPIQLVFDPEGSYLYYKHPTTEIKKEVDTMTTSASLSVVISSESLEKILASPTDIDEVVFEFSDQCDGVRCIMAEGLIDSLMAILTA